MNRLTIEKLNSLALTGLWRSNRQLQVDIFNRYLELTRESDYPNFASPEFWSTLFGNHSKRAGSEPAVCAESLPKRQRRSSASPSCPDDVDFLASETSDDELTDSTVDSAVGPSNKQHGGAVVTRRQTTAVRSRSSSSDSDRASPAQGPSNADYSLTEIDRIYVKKFRVKGRFFELKLHNDQNPLKTLHEAFSAAIRRGFEMYQDGLVGMEVNADDLERPILIPFSDKEKMTTDNALNLIRTVMQSAKDLKFGSKMHIKVVGIHQPKAGGPGKVKGLRLREHPSCVTKMIGHAGKSDCKDKLCVARCIVYEMARQRQDESREAHNYWKQIQKQDKRKTMRQAALDLMTQAGIEEGKLCGRPELENFSCPARCSNCRMPGGDCSFESWRKCATCGRRFPSDSCFAKHLEITGKQKKSTCDQLRVCPKCHKYVRSTTRKHHCGEVKCGSCRQYVNPVDHQWECYIQPLKKTGTENYTTSDTEEDGYEDEPFEDDEESTGMIFFDLETTQEVRMEDGSMKHIPNFCVAQKVCDSCMAEWSPDTECDTCEVAETVFSGDDCMAQFADWLLQPEHQKWKVFAHNFKGFDGQFILKCAVERGIKPSTIMRGLSIITMDIEKIKFLDSLSFMPMPLAQLPYAFGFEDEVIKEWFPHKFNRTENQNYVGPYPSPDNYGADQMKPKERSKFLTWHEAQKGKDFDFAREMRRYCEDDVNILRRAVLEFRRVFIEATTVDPFQSVTLPAACSRVFRKLFLDEKTIGIIPHQGYRRSQIQSDIATRWLMWIAHSREINIQHARNKGEYRIGKYLVDGFSAETNTVFEFNGCIWHGCLCIKNRHKNVPNSALTMEEAYNLSRDRRTFIISLGYKFEEIWQCEFQTEKKTNLEMSRFIDDLDLIPPLDPRSCLFGGRVNPITLYKEVSGDETIQYADFVSLYPTVLKKEVFPLGHPVVTTDGFPEIYDEIAYFGAICCNVTPPRGLYHPLLPSRINGKLMFNLCRTCAEDSQQTPCLHTDAERQLHGTWVTPELQKALDLGYRITKIYEVWDYSDRSDPSNVETFFPAYVNLFLKLKTEASGYPTWVKTEADKQGFIDDFEEGEGVHLDKHRIAKNPGLRLIAKLCLNTLWGKFAQRNFRSKFEYIDSAREYFELISDPAITIDSIQFCGGEILGIGHTKDNPFVDALPYTNPIVASFVTAYARLRLYDVMAKLDRRVLYTDTDSVSAFNF